MSTAAPPPAAPKPPPTNRLGLPQAQYKGAESTLCAGCGHDSITSQLIKALFEMDVEPYNVAKMSGIGCSSKTTAYFLGQSHGFNGVHGRMPAMATGSYLANRKLVHVGISGDGDTASIGLGHFLHCIRRNVPLLYIIENNGVYGLTKGQFSATADRGSIAKKGFENDMPPIDCCALAIQMGCDYVARSFSGDIKQLVPLLKGAIAHPGFAVIDIVSPCVTFNNHEGSTKSFKFAKEHEDPLHEVGFVPYHEEIKVDYEPGTAQDVELADGSHIILKKLGHEYDPTDRTRALQLLHKAQEERLFLTGLIYYNQSTTKALADQLNMSETPLAKLSADVLRPGPEALAEVMESLK
jgi:2-oxoglutarate/2-oxoacid ferredoxin oxidoreductase subunit beta